MKYETVAAPKLQVEVYTPKEPTPPPPKVLRLKLEPRHAGGARLIAVDEQGRLLESGNLLVITEKGIYFSQSVDAAIGLPLDHYGRVVKLEECP